VGPIVRLLILATLLASAELAAQDALRAALTQRIDVAKHGTGAVVGLLNAQGRSFAAYGRVRIDGPPTTPDTIAEIGSIGKVFTAFLLADMVERGEVALDDPVRKFLPRSVTVPSFNGKDITLADLATHTSGLPRDSVPVDLESDRSPYEGYTAEQLYAFLGRYRLERAPGAMWEYSNVGAGLMGHALALRAGVAYEDLVRRRLFDPLGMTSTRITFDAEQQARRATGHSGKLMPLPPWSGGVIAPTGEWNSTAADMLKFAADALDERSPRRAVYARMTSVKRPGSESGRNQQALGWELFRFSGSDMMAHNGGTFGFEARFLVDTTRRRAVIAWANGRSGNGVVNLVGAALNERTLQP
jgi:CubicO group peptidase (beta-lactamase class C family)